MKDILVLCPQERDFNAIRAAGLEQRYRVRFAGSDLDRLESFDPQAFLAEAEPIPAGAVVGTRTSPPCSPPSSPSAGACRGRVP